ncbi:NIL domain-containing protein [bacterium]
MNKRLVLKFSHALVDKPILSSLVKDYNLVFNILKASITPQENGLLIVDLDGEDQKFAQAMKYLEKIGVEIEPLDKDVFKIEEKCTHCGACLAVCPTSALYIDRETWKVIFDKEKCIACGLCIKACPPHAMEINF